jgi:hypothetical protein
LGVNVRSSAAAEKGGEGMALKIFTGAKPFLKAGIKPFGITEIEMLPLRCSICSRIYPVGCFKEGFFVNMILPSDFVMILPMMAAEFNPFSLSFVTNSSA